MGLKQISCKSFSTTSIQNVHACLIIMQGFIKGQAQGKLTSCEHEFVPLFLTLGLQHNCTEVQFPYAWVLGPDALLLQILMNPLNMY